MASKRLFLSSIILFVLFSFPLISSVGASSMMWSQTYGSGKECAYSLVQTSDGGYALAGGELLVKTDAYGNMEWNQTYLGGRAYSLVQTSDGGYALAGTADSLDEDYDFWLVKTDAQGNMEWNKTYGGSDNEAANSPGSLVETSDGGFALAGYTGSFFGPLNFWLVKTDADGNMVWNQTYGGAGDEQAFSLVESSDGGYALAGYTTSFYAGPPDFWLVKTDEFGIIPEFPSWAILPIILLATVVVIVYKKKLTKHSWIH